MISGNDINKERWSKVSQQLWELNAVHILKKGNDDRMWKCLGTEEMRGH